MPLDINITLHFETRRDKRHKSDVGYEPDLKHRQDVRRKVNVQFRLPPRKWPVRAQGALPSCTAHAAAGVAHFAMLRSRRRPRFEPSRLFVYHCERVLGSKDPEIAKNPRWLGTVRYAMDVMRKHGMCADRPARDVPPHAVWPYSKRLREHPPKACFDFADEHRVREVKYFLKSELAHLRGCLAEGHPFTICIDAHAWGVADFNFARDEPSPGTLVMPASGDIEMPPRSAPRVYSHAMIVVGYDDDARRFIVRNSLGTKWGRHGHGTIPYDYVLDPKLCDSFWTLRIPRH